MTVRPVGRRDTALPAIASDGRPARSREVMVLDAGEVGKDGVAGRRVPVASDSD